MSDTSEKVPVGCWVHVIKNNRVERQGCIFEQIPSHGEPWFVVMWYSWVDGDSTWMSIVKASDMVEWRIFNEWEKWFKAGNVGVGEKA